MEPSQEGQRCTSYPDPMLVCWRQCQSKWAIVRIVCNPSLPLTLPIDHEQDVFVL